MFIKKRDGQMQQFNKNKITKRINDMINKQPILNINIDEITREVCDHIKDGITTSELDEFTAEVCAYRVTESPDYDVLATRIIVSNNHKNSEKYKNFSDMIRLMHKENKLISSTFLSLIEINKDILDRVVNDNHEKDYINLTYFGFKTLEKSYLIKIKTDNKVICERPQHLLMRVAFDLNRYNIDDALECYKYLSDFYLMHATPTLFNSGMKESQYLSCFLLGVGDSITSMYDKLVANCAQISKRAGGIGVHLSNIRAEGSIINSTLGKSNGILPYIKVLNELAKHVTQGGRRNGSIAIYIEPYHSDIIKFLELKKNTGSENHRARDLFYALYIPNLFMKRLIYAIENEGEIVKWSLMCPYECPYLSDVYGEEFDKLYTQYENEAKYKEQVNILDLWKQIITTQLETSLPYIVFKDHVNNKSNQKNIGTIKSSNLCVSGDTYILTDKGQIKINELLNMKIKVWNGEEFSETIVRKTGVDQELLKITLSNGVDIKCTPYHHFWLVDKKGKEYMVEAKELKWLDELIKYNLPIICIEDRVAIDKWLKVNADKNGIITDEHSKLIQVRLLLQTLGIDSHLIGIGKLQVDPLESIKVIKVEKLEEREDTYCFTEQKRNRGMFNGLLLGQCTEIMEYSSEDEYACCTLGSLCLHKFVENGEFNFDKLRIVTGIITRNLNNAINQNYYPCKETSISNFKHRPLSIGVQGLAETFIKMKYPYESLEAQQLNSEIFETIYYSALEMSNNITLERREILTLLYDDRDELVKLSSKHHYLTYNLHKPTENATLYEKELYAKERYRQNIINESIKFIIEENGLEIMDNIINGVIHIHELQFIDFTSEHLGSYSSYDGSPLSEGIMQYDMWNIKPGSKWDWNGLKEKIYKYGTCNSLLTGLMPTATTAQITGSTEAFEPITSNIYGRSVMSGNFMVVNKYLQRDLMELGLWNKEMKDKIIENRGSISNIDNIPDRLKELYKTAWDIKKRLYIQMSADRGAYIDQSQSLNLFIANPDYNNVTSCHVHSWKLGLKTGMYYLRRKPNVNAIQFTLQKNDDERNKMIEENKNKLDDLLHEKLLESANGAVCYKGCQSCQ